MQIDPAVRKLAAALSAAALFSFAYAAQAQFTAPTCTPPNCSPAVIQNIPLTGSTQNAGINISGDIKAGATFQAAQTLLPLGTVAAPTYTFVGDTNTGFYSPAVDQIGITTGGAQRFLVNGSGATVATGQLTLPVGSAAVPAMTFAGDTNTGIFHNAADTLNLATNGVSRLAVDSAGAVTVPGNLTVSGSLTATFAGDGSLLTNLNAGNIATGTLNDARLSSNIPRLNAANAFTGNNTLSGMSSFGSSALVLAAGQNLVYGNIATGSTGNLLLLQKNSADQFRVDPSGNIVAAGGLTATTGTFSGNVSVAGQSVCRADGTNCPPTINGSGTTNFVLKFTPSGNVVGNSQLQDDGTGVGVGGVPVAGIKLSVAGNIGMSSGSYLSAINNGTGAVLRTSRSDNTQVGQIKTNGWGNFSTSSGLAVGYDWPNSPQSGLIVNGNLGIGIAAPLGKVQIATNDDTNPTSVSAWDARHFVVGQPANAGAVGISYNNTGGYGIIDALSPGVAWKNLILQSGGGNVGIGTLAPSQRLEVNGTAAASKIIAGGGASSNWADVNAPVLMAGSVIYSYGSICAGESNGNCTGNGGVVIGGSDPNAWTNLTSSGNSFFTGRLGIGTKTPTAPLAVETWGDDYAGTFFNGSAGFGGASRAIFAQAGNFAVGAGTEYAIQADAYSNGASAYALYATASCLSCGGAAWGVYIGSGGAAKPGGGPWSATSDRRVKKDITPFKEGLNVLRQINPINYTYNGLGEMPEGFKAVGVIAQDVKKIAPYMVTTDYRKLRPTDTEKTPIYMVDPNDFTYMTINAIKELDLRIDGLEARVAGRQDDQDRRIQALEAEVSALQAEVKALKP